MSTATAAKFMPVVVECGRCGYGFTEEQRATLRRRLKDTRAADDALVFGGERSGGLEYSYVLNRVLQVAVTTVFMPRASQALDAGSEAGTPLLSSPSHASGIVSWFTGISDNKPHFFCLADGLDVGLAPSNPRPADLYVE